MDTKKIPPGMEHDPCRWFSVLGGRRLKHCSRQILGLVVYKRK